MTDEEIADGFALVWMTPVEAIRTMEAETPLGRSGKFIRMRDLGILREYEKRTQ